VQRWRRPSSARIESRTILIMGEITPMVAERITAQLLALSGQSREPIRLFIPSNGGHVESGDTRGAGDP
jgi:ATP-dependent Clp protease protease subunit